ncbi:PREDICTED: aspartyl/asparaginyl beta-hydroxylase-like, partial [Chlamydotis macqueenii]|uniref:aspartyl/asparaginyl beta-hydroxylase-like n=1 Tax=Chlamydotis macqueenii TaxID=187382 RepID=UPI000529E0F4
MADDTETKHGGGKNGKKEGLSGSSFFTWFMVIALLGVWTSVAVVWFELVDYEEVLGKLGIYDADGDGDFDVEDAKVLLGEEPGGVAKKKTKVKVKEAVKEPLKKLREKQESKKEQTKDEEEKKKARKGKDAADQKDKKAVDMNKLKKDPDKAKRDKGKEKEKGLDKNVKPKETIKKSASEKDGTIQLKMIVEGSLKERSVPAQPASPESEETIQPAEKLYVESEHKNADVELEEEIQSVLHEDLHSQPGEKHEDVDEGINDQWQAKEEIRGESFEAPTTDDLFRDLGNEVPEAHETPDSVQKDAHLLADDLGVMEPEPYEPPVSYEYDMDVEKTVSEPEAPGDSEQIIEDPVEHYTEDRVHGDYNEEHEFLLLQAPVKVHISIQAPKLEKVFESFAFFSKEMSWMLNNQIIEDFDTDKELSAVEDLPEEMNEATEPDEIIEDFDTDKELSESKHTEDVVAAEPEESEIPVPAEDYSNDDLAAKKKKPKLLNKFDKTIKAELDAAEKLRKK